jgi:hypothetical protein
MMRHHLLKRFDTDGDHKLSDEERAAAKEAVKVCWKKLHARLLEKFDANHDGKLDDAERAAAREARKARHQGENATKGTTEPAPSPTK